MGDFVHTVGESVVASQHTGGEEARFETILPYRTRPCILRTLRVYEHAVGIPDKDIADIVSDALALGRRDEVDAIIREFGIVGEWRPSSILVTLVQNTTNKILVQDAPAHALWNTDFDYGIGTNDVFAIIVKNTTPRVRRVRPVLHFHEQNPMTFDLENEVRLLRNHVANQRQQLAEISLSIKKQHGTVASNSPYDLGSFRSPWSDDD